MVWTHHFMGVWGVRGLRELHSNGAIRRYHNKNKVKENNKKLTSYKAVKKIEIKKLIDGINAIGISTIDEVSGIGFNSGSNVLTNLFGLVKEGNDKSTVS